MTAQPEEVHPPSEAQTEEHPGLVKVRGLINTSGDWGVLYVDRIEQADAYVFYLRSRKTWRFRNVLDEYVVTTFESWQRVNGDIVRDHPEETAKRMLEFARRELKAARDCI